MIKRLIYLMLFICVNSAQASPVQVLCPDVMKIRIENDQEVYFCKLDNLMVSKDCYDKKSECALAKDYKANLKKIKDSKPLTFARTQNPGSMICQLLKWKVLMGYMADGSQVCTCEHPSGSKSICTSMIPKKD